MFFSCNLTKPERFIRKGILWLFAIGSIMHFLYQLLGESIVVGLFAPTNESVWEHLKMVALPMILWWGIYYLIYKNKYNINKKAWFTGALAALITALFMIPLIFYFYTNAFGVEYVWVDILMLLIGIFIGQWMGLHFYRHSSGIPVWIAIFLMVVIVALFAIFTIFPPNLPIFQSNV